MLNKLSDYEQALIRVKDMPKIYLGQVVKTPLGKGIAVRLEMEYNGLYINPERSYVEVWFSTVGAKCGWVSHTYKLSELKINDRKEKLEKLDRHIQEK